MLPVLFYYFLVVRGQVLFYSNEGMSEFIKTNMSWNCVRIEIRKSLEVLVQNISAVKKWQNDILDIAEEAKALLVMNGKKISIWWSGRTSL